MSLLMRLGCGCLCGFPPVAPVSPTITKMDQRLNIRSLSLVPGGSPLLPDAQQVI